MASLADLDRLMDLFALAKDSVGDSLTAFELMPEVGVAKVCDTFDREHPMPSRAEFYVLVKLASGEPVTNSLTDFLADADDAGLILDAVVASTPDQERRLWEIRDDLPPMGLYPHHGVGLKMDTAVPIARMGEYHDAVRDIADELVPGAVAYGFGHVGDGNLHMTVLPLDDDDVEPFKSKKAELVRRIDEATFSLGGTLSAEHGIGRELRDRVAGQKPPIEWEMMRSIKDAFDPDDRLNPGAMLPEPP